MWNYRLIEYSPGDIRIHEVYYNAKGKIESWTENPICVSGENFNDAWNCYVMMKEAFYQPVLSMTIDGKLIEL